MVVVSLHLCEVYVATEVGQKQHDAISYQQATVLNEENLQLIVFSLSDFCFVIHLWKLKRGICRDVKTNLYLLSGTTCLIRRSIPQNSMYYIAQSYQRLNSSDSAN